MTSVTVTAPIVFEIQPGLMRACESFHGPSCFLSFVVNNWIILARWDAHRVSWDRVQVLLGEKVYRSHELTYAGGLIHCKHCGGTITGESVIKKSSGKEYVYYRSSLYNTPGHPRVRLAEGKLDQQLMAIFDKMRIGCDQKRDWVADEIRNRIRLDQEASKEKRTELNRQLTLVLQHKHQLVNMRLNGEIESDTYTAKAAELRDRTAMLKLKFDACDLGRDENGEIAIKAFELSQSLRVKWLAADYAEKRRVLEIVFLNFVLDGVTLLPETRKPFDLLAEGLLVSSSRGDRTPLELFLAGLAGWDGAMWKRLEDRL